MFPTSNFGGGQGERSPLSSRLCLPGLSVAVKAKTLSEYYWVPYFLFYLLWQKIVSATQHYFLLLQQCICENVTGKYGEMQATLSWTELEL